MNFFAENKELLIDLIAQGLNIDEIFDLVKDKEHCPAWEKFKPDFQFFQEVIKDYVPPADSTNCNYKGWTLRKRDGKYYELYRSFSGVVKVIYIGKVWNERKADEKIREFFKKMIFKK